MPKETIVLVHGLWANGLDMSVINYRLRNSGFMTEQFVYKSVRRNPVENAEKLTGFIDNIKAQTLHFVCHSMGGMVVRQLFHRAPGQRPGRVITLGTPHQPSSAARSLCRFSPGRFLLGRSIEGGFLDQLPPWPSTHELGSIAGTMGLGLGLFVPGVPKPSDGTVAVEETKFAGMKDHRCFPVSHFGLLLSRPVADAASHFLKQGQFDQDLCKLSPF